MWRTKQHSMKICGEQLVWADTCRSASSTTLIIRVTSTGQESNCPCHEVLQDHPIGIKERFPLPKARARSHKKDAAGMTGSLRKWRR